jgi:GTP:adenosylcobinamide-phosphate guanylyltransferase
LSKSSTSGTERKTGAEKSAIIVLGNALGNAQWPVLRRYVDRVVVAVNASTPGSFAEVDIPFE